MFLLKIANKFFFSYNVTICNYIEYLFNNIKTLKFVEKEIFSFYARLLFLFLLINLYHLKIKTNYFVTYMRICFFNNKKLISYIININLSSTNTLINVNNIKGSPKFFYSAGMFNLQKTQKTRQPKAIIIILRALLLRSKNFKTKPLALHFNNLFLNYQSYIFKKLKRKIFMKLIVSYIVGSHNGCRLKKKKRIKIRTRTKKLKKE